MPRGGNQRTIEPGSVEHLSQLISHVVAPAILFGVISGIAALVLIIASFFLLCPLISFFVDVRLALAAHDLH